MADNTFRTSSPEPEYQPFPADWGPAPRDQQQERKSNNRRFAIFLGFIVGPLILLGLAFGNLPEPPPAATEGKTEATKAAETARGPVALGCPTIDALMGVYSASGNGARSSELNRVIKSYDCEWVYVYTVIHKLPVVSLVLSGGKRLYIPTQDIR